MKMALSHTNKKVFPTLLIGAIFVLVPLLFELLTFEGDVYPASPASYLALLTLILGIALMWLSLVTYAKKIVKPKESLGDTLTVLAVSLALLFLAGVPFYLLIVSLGL